MTAGLTHVRPADWLDRPIGEPEVPAGVAATFARGGRNFQRTHGDTVERRTAELWAAVKSVTSDYPSHRPGARAVSRSDAP